MLRGDFVTVVRLLLLLALVALGHEGHFSALEPSWFVTSLITRLATAG